MQSDENTVANKRSRRFYFFGFCFLAVLISGVLPPNFLRGDDVAADGRVIMGVDTFYNIRRPWLIQVCFWDSACW